ncbi:hypothetical protein [Promicromonospora sukumoe]|uniref:hypothetical protein n=1 Tax=Promicromonospora sukumoe TaxID=88382 RepID=UPI003661FC20
MRRILTRTIVLTLALLTVGTGIATATQSPSPSPSPSVPDGPPRPAFVEAPTFTCDTDPSDDVVLPADTEAITYTLEDGVFLATLSAGYEWGETELPDPWRQAGYTPYPGFEIPVTGPTDPRVMPLADMAFPSCSHDDETLVTLSTECTDGTGYLVYDIEAPWAPAGAKIVDLYANTSNEADGAISQYSGIGLSGRLAWDGSSPGGDGYGFSGTPSDPDIDNPVLTLRHETPEGAHRAIIKGVDFLAVDPCDGVGGGGDGGDRGTAGGDEPAGPDEELVVTG